MLLAVACIGCSPHVEINVREARVPRREWLDRHVSTLGFIVTDNGHLFLADRPEYMIRAVPLVARTGTEWYYLATGRGKRGPAGL